MYGITWPQVRNLLQNLMTLCGGFLAGRYPNIDWPLVGSIVMSIAAVVWTARTGQKDVLISDVATLRAANGVELVRKVEINPAAEEAPDVEKATPDNVQRPK